MMTGTPRKVSALCGVTGGAFACTATLGGCCRRPGPEALGLALLLQHPIHRRREHYQRVDAKPTHHVIVPCQTTSSDVRPQKPLHNASERRSGGASCGAATARRGSQGRGAVAGSGSGRVVMSRAACDGRAAAAGPMPGCTSKMRCASRNAGLPSESARSLIKIGVATKA
eukprot:scaffold518_cov388-Prasinococcus_capsulatus_cf.AAC.57